MTDFPYWQREAFNRFYKKALWETQGNDTRSDEEITITCTRVEAESFIHAHALAWVETQQKYMELVKDEFGKYAIGMDIVFLDRVMLAMSNLRFIAMYENKDEIYDEFDRCMIKLHHAVSEAKAKQKERE